MSGTVISIESGRGFRRAPEAEVIAMPVSRAYINTFATVDTDTFQAFTDLANFADALEQAVGVRVGAAASSGGATPPPPAASWTITAANGHFLVQITNPAGNTAATPLQHQFCSATDSTFDAAGGATTYTLGVGETTRDIVDPGVTKYWRLQSRYPGSAWNSWQTYATTTGVTALTTGALKTA